MSDAYLPLMFGNYLIEARIGQGGMGVVYRARHTYLDRLAALKIVHESLVRTPGARERFLHEARTAALLKHANLAQVYDYGEDGGRAYLAMEYVEGQPLDEVLLAGLMNPTRALALLEQVASALDYIHQQGVVHRDLKPSNIMVTSDDLAVVVDFGIARALETATASQDGQIVGTLAYCAPEQLQGDALTPAVDGYALGVIAYEMLTGRPPFEADTPQGLIWGIAFEPPPPPRGLRPDMPEAVERVLIAQLAKNPAERYPTGAAFVAALRSAARQRPYSTLSELGLPLRPPSAPLRPADPLPVMPAIEPPVEEDDPPDGDLPILPAVEAWGAGERPHRRRASQSTGLALALLALLLIAAALVALFVMPPRGSAAALAETAFEAETTLASFESLPRIVGPVVGQLGADVPTVTVSDFVAKATFVNPAGGAWRYGLTIGDVSVGGYRLVLSRPGLLSPGDPGRWELRFEQGSAVRTVANGGLSVFNTSEASANLLVLVARGRSGYLWVNGTFAGALDLSAANGARTLRLVGDQPSAYRDFEVQAQ